MRINLPCSFVNSKGKIIHGVAIDARPDGKTVVKYYSRGETYSVVIPNHRVSYAPKENK